MRFNFRDGGCMSAVRGRQGGREGGREGGRIFLHVEYIYVCISTEGKEGGREGGKEGGREGREQQRTS